MPQLIKVGDTLPPFLLKDQNRREISNDNLLGKVSVFYFYPKDGTPGCTREACDYRDAMPLLQRQDVQIFGVSADSAESHQKFIKKYTLPFPLLCDTNRSVAEQWGLVTTSNFFGKLKAKILRATLIVGPDATVVWMENNVKVDGHVKRVLQAIETIQK